ncbi:hypothetical protein ACLKA7_016332 [Drosophila subpalustris]
MLWPWLGWVGGPLGCPFTRGEAMLFKSIVTQGFEEEEEASAAWEIKRRDVNSDKAQPLSIDKANREYSMHCGPGHLWNSKLNTVSLRALDKRVGDDGNEPKLKKCSYKKTIKFHQQQSKPNP